MGARRRVCVRSRACLHQLYGSGVCKKCLRKGQPPGGASLRASALHPLSRRGRGGAVRRHELHLASDGATAAVLSPPASPRLPSAALPPVSLSLASAIGSSRSPSPLNYAPSAPIPSSALSGGAGGGLAHPRHACLPRAGDSGRNQRGVFYTRVSQRRACW